MHDLTGQTITKVVGNGQLSIHTDAGWVISIESNIVYEAADGTTTELVGDEAGAAESLAPALVGHIIQSSQLSQTGGFTMTIVPNMRLSALPDDDFEAWNIVGPEGQRTVSMPGGELAVWDATAPDT